MPRVTDERRLKRTATAWDLYVATERLLKLHATALALLHFADAVCEILKAWSDSVRRMYGWFKVMINDALSILHLHRTDASELGG